MRKALVATIAMLLVSAGVWGVAKSQRNYSDPHPKVVAEIARIASTSGANITEERKVSASFRNSRLGAVNSLFLTIFGGSLDDLEEYTLQDGYDNVRVSVYHSQGKVGLVEIRPSSNSSKPAAALLSGLTASFPKLDCHLEGP